ncbi:adenosylcobinamide-phosphate synthase CbiB [Synechococcus elongatus]|uniref:adenosylcobinamide-phosphate synthase CbiB n=1 Tax=Synechococcus elongatus TaxID=32046 RepID=UPI000F7D6D79|nr:adenosylcobinamide-phosphate synthase CbiB [Synechococcus elongatus]
MMSASLTTIAVLGLAALLDYGVGDPWGWPHPVQALGWVIACWRDWTFRWLKSAIAQRISGMVLTIVLVAGSAIASWVAFGAIARLSPLLSAGLQVILLASCFAGRSLREAAAEVLKPLAAEDLPAARRALSRYVGRDTDQLSALEIQRAVLETVTENSTDGVLAPLFYAGLGVLLGLGPVPLAIAYKAASTLDSMVGYRRPPYTYLGWFPARSEDVWTWLPCRLVVLTITLLSGRPRQVWRICWRDAPADPSPNAGWSEAAYAAALGVQVGGDNVYQGQIVSKPLLGDPQRSLDATVIQQALQLTRIAFLLWLAVIAGLLLALGH